jgi:chromosome segregation ATPase
MESKQHAHPSLVLINDEILSTQVRLMELYVKQAEAMAANEAARTQERFQTELTTLQEKLKQKEIALETQQALSRQADQDLRAEVQELRARLLATQCSLQVRQTELDFARADAHVLQQRIAQSESTVQKAYASIEIEVARARETWQEELSALEEQLESKESALQRLQASVKEVEGNLRAENQDLRSQLASKVELLKNRTDELQNAQRETALLRQHMQQFALTGAKTEAAASEAIRIRETLQAELTSLRTAYEQKDISFQQSQATTRELEERLTAQLHDLENQLGEKQTLLEARSQEVGELTAKTSDLQEQITCLELANRQTVKEAKAAARAVEDSLRARIQELEATVSEKAQGLQNRTVELESVQSETALLRERIQQLEQIGAQTEEAKNEADRRREALQNELGNVHRALQQKEALLAQREVEFKESSEDLHTQLLNLQNQLTEERAVLERQQRELQETTSEMIVLRGRVHDLESAKAAAEAQVSVEIEHVGEQFQTELIGLRAELDQRQVVLDERQTTILALEEKLKNEVLRLDAQLAEKQTLLNRSHLELQEKDSEVSALREQITQSEFARRQTEMFATTQAEQIRERVKAVVGELDSQLSEKENALKVAANRAQELESVFSARIDDLQLQLTEKQSLMESRDNELTDLRSQISSLLTQVSDSERANAAALEQRLEASRLEQQIRVQVTELQAQMAEKLTVLETRNDEIHALESRISGLVERIGQAEVAFKQAEATATGEIEQMRRQSQAELAARQAEDEQKVEAFQQREAALLSAEQDLQLEIDRLRAEVAEKHSLLEDRNDELVRVKTEIEALRERIADLESAVKQAEHESLIKPEHTGEHARTAVESLWEALSQKERVLEERQAAVNDLEQNFQSQIDSLRTELAEKEALLENPNRGFLLGEPTLTETQKEKLNRLEQLVETIKADNEQTLISSHNRRWRFSLGRKRRWKS